MRNIVAYGPQNLSRSRECSASRIRRAGRNHACHHFAAGSRNDAACIGTRAPHRTGNAREGPDRDLVAARPKPRRMKITPHWVRHAGRRSPVARPFIPPCSGSHLSPPARRTPPDGQGHSFPTTPTGLSTADRAGGCNGRHALNFSVNAGRKLGATLPANFVPGAVFSFNHGC